MIDARRMEVYCLLTDTQGKLLETAHPRVVEEDSFQKWLDSYSVIFFGDGAAKCKPLFSSHPNALFIDEIYPTAHHVGNLAYRQFQQDIFEKLDRFVPLYLKPFQTNLIFPRENIASEFGTNKK